MVIVLLFMFTLSLSKQCSEYGTNTEVDTVSSAFECINSIKTDETQSTELITELKEWIDMYAFKDILKNPPQPLFDSSYYEKVDIDAGLDAIDKTSIVLYDFFSSIASIVVSTRDLHLGFVINPEPNKDNAKLLNFYYSLPFKISISTDKKMYLHLPDVPSLFPDNVPSSIKEHTEVAVKTINGEDPFEIIRTFGDKFVGLKCPHARFTKAQTSIAFGNLAQNPLPQSYLSDPLQIIWEDDSSAAISYTVIKIAVPSLSARAKKNLLERVKNGIKAPLKPEDIFDSVYLKKMKNTPKSAITSDDGSVACLVSPTKKVNTFVLVSFLPNNKDSFIDVLSKCVDLFDENDYPIQVILPMNEGGYVILEQYIEHIFAPHNDVNLIVSSRISSKTEQVMKTIFSTEIKDPKTCEAREKKGVDKLGEWYTNPKTVKYGDVEHKITQPSLIEEFYVKKTFTKHPRKPTEIVVYTDSFCFSCCSIFTKGLKERGSAIITGFCGDPNGEDNEFEVGQSPTSVFPLSVFPNKKDTVLYKYGYDLSVSFMESFRFNYNYTETIPREFLTDMVDERVNIYEFSSDNIAIFSDKTLAILEKYKTQCNPLNKRLVKEDSACDDKITIENAHGGYVCGDDGKWTTTCVASYCDEGYIFDYNNQVCIVLKCKPNEPANESESKSEDNSESKNTGDNENESSKISIISALFILLLVLIL